MGSPKQTGSTTSTTTLGNKTADTLLPYLTYGLDSAKNTFNTNNDNSTSLNDALYGGYQQLNNVATDKTTSDTGGNAENTLNNYLTGGGSIYDSPAYLSLTDLSGGTTGSQKKESTIGDSLYDLSKTTNKDYGTGTDELTKESSGYYLNSNPYLDAMYKAGAKQVGDYYQTYTAPNTDSTYETSGRYGSGSALNAQGQNELNLGYALDKLSADTYGTNYMNERKLQNTAASDLGTLGQNQQKLQGSLLDAAGKTYGDITTGRNTATNNLQTGYDKGNATTLNALSLYPATQKQKFYPALQQIDAAKGMYSTPYTNTSDYLGLIPSITGSSTTGTKTDPIYGPNGLSTAVSLLGTGASLLGTDGLSGLGKGSSWAGSNFA